MERPGQTQACQLSQVLCSCFACCGWQHCAILQQSYGVLRNANGTVQRCCSLLLRLVVSTSATRRLRKWCRGISYNKSIPTSSHLPLPAGVAQCKHRSSREGRAQWCGGGAAAVCVQPTNQPTKTTCPLTAVALLASTLARLSIRCAASRDLIAVGSPCLATNAAATSSTSSQERTSIRSLCPSPMSTVVTSSSRTPSGDGFSVASDSRLSCSPIGEVQESSPGVGDARCVCIAARPSSASPDDISWHRCCALTAPRPNAAIGFATPAAMSRH